MRSEGLLLVGFAAVTALAAPDITAAAILPRQTDDLAGSDLCNANDNQILSFDNCIEYGEAINPCLDGFSAIDYDQNTAAINTCGCNFAANMMACATSFCATANFAFYTDFSSASVTSCDSLGIKPTPFKYTGQTYSFNDGPQETGPAGGSGSNGGSNGGGNAGGNGGGSSPTTSATKSASKNAGAGFAPPRLLGGEAAVLSAFAVAWAMGFVGMLWI